MKAFILAAGKGERLKPITDEWPKPAVPILNIPLIYFVATPFIRMGAQELIFNLHHLPKGIETALAPFYQLVPVKFTDETEKLLGSGGGIWNAKKFLEREECFFVGNGDEVFLPDNDSFLADALEYHKSSGALATLVTIDHKEVGTKFGGVWVDKDNNVKEFGKTPKDSSLAGRHFIGFQIVSNKVFDYLPIGESHIFLDVYLKAMKDGHAVKSYHTSGTWFETGNETDFLKATETLIEMHEKKISVALEDMLSIYWVGNSIESNVIAKSASISKRTLLSSGSVITDDVQLKGFNVIGEQCQIHPGAVLENTVILPGTIVPEGYQAKNQILFSEMPKI